LKIFFPAFSSAICLIPKFKSDNATVQAINPQIMNLPINGILEPEFQMAWQKTTVPKGA